MLDATEELLTLAAATRELPGRVHPSTIWRWARNGVRARNGLRVRLAHRRLGRRVYVTREALHDFSRALAEADCVAFDDTKHHRTLAPKLRSTSARERAISAAEKRLAEARIQ